MFPKTLVVSDLHLTTDFDLKKYLFLERLFRQFDRIIINGDFWCAYSNTFDQFLNSKWRNLFSLLKSKETIYLNGNHDPKKFTDERVNQFCNLNQESYDLLDTPYKFHIEHGPRITHQKYGHSLLYYRLIHFIHLFRYIYLAQSVVFRLSHYLVIKLINQKNNNLLRRYAQEFPANEYLVAGHTHLPESDLAHKFINTGFIGNGAANYLAIYGDSFELISANY